VSEARLTQVKLLITQTAKLRLATLDNYVGGVSRAFGRDYNIGAASKLAHAIWKLRKQLKPASPDWQGVQALWDALGAEVNHGNPLPTNTTLEAFQKLFIEWLFPPPPPPPPPTDDELLQLFSPYLGTVADKCWQLVTRGIIADNTTLRLGQVYVSLDTKTPRPRRTDEPEAMQHTERTLSALEALFETETDAPARRVVLVGEPGSGKSTFFQFVTLCLTYQHSRAEGEAAKKHFADLEERVPEILRNQTILPCRIILREFAPWLGDRAGTADEVVNFLMAPLVTLGYHEAAGKLPEALERGLSFVLFDGLDEVPKGQVSAVKQAITAFRAGQISEVPRRRHLPHRVLQEKRIQAAWLPCAIRNRPAVIRTAIRVCPGLVQGTGAGATPVPRPGRRLCDEVD
jgi:hypothetical protein